MAKRLDITYSHTTSSSLSTNYLNGMRDEYRATYGRLMLVNKILYKFNGVHTETRVLTKISKVVKESGFVKPDIDISRLVILGGTFERVGGEDEAIGGGTQKVGSDNQR